jgi:DNA-binding NarL/FixJ family response regulator
MKHLRDYVAARVLQVGPPSSPRYLSRVRKQRFVNLGSELRRPLHIRTTSIAPTACVLSWPNSGAMQAMAECCSRGRLRPSGGPHHQTALEALLWSSAPFLQVRVGRANEAAFLPRVEDAESGRWIAIVEEHDVFRASEALALGASGILIPGMDSCELEAALRTLYSSEAPYVPSALSAGIATPGVVRPWRGLVAGGTPSLRELEVLALVTQGRSNSEIARNLGLSVNTVRTHLRSLFAKLGATSRTKLIRAAWETGYATEPADRQPSGTDAGEAPAASLQG